MRAMPDLFNHQYGLERKLLVRFLVRESYKYLPTSYSVPSHSVLAECR